jgi:hypothetical protein
MFGPHRCKVVHSFPESNADCTAFGKIDAIKGAKRLERQLSWLA